ncbi:MAG: hypothetical protein M1608_13270, partial [Candidatus Omnitrophica bacterium]|nr:hypothetical protein [Candidatus Omnitrophota bacterium]
MKHTKGYLSGRFDDRSNASAPNRRFGSRIGIPLLLVICNLALHSVPVQGGDLESTAGSSLAQPVGPVSSKYAVLPVNQTLTPAGQQVELPDMRPQVICLSPDGRLLATSGKTPELVIIDPSTCRILERVPFPSESAKEPAPGSVSSQILEPDKAGQVSYTGLVFSPDGKRIYLSNVNGSLKVFGVTPDHRVSSLYSIPLPDTGLASRKREIPAGLAFSPDGKRLYVVLNLSNRLLEMDAASGKPLRTFDVGIAPYQVVLVGGKAYVSNWGGRRPDAGSVTSLAGLGVRVRVDPVRFIANEGSVSVIDLKSGQVTREIIVGLHSSGMALSPVGRHLVVANAGSDTLSVIDTRQDSVVETIPVRWSRHDLFGASPNALVFAPSGNTVYVCNGTQNALAVVSFQPGHSQLRGLIPTGWFPGAIACDGRRNTLCVANIKGIGSWKQYG